MIITTQDRLEDFCETLKQQDFITIDTEFVREKTYYPKLCLIQVSTPDGQAAAIDPIAGQMDLGPIMDIFFNAKILKVIHAGRQDLEIFYNMTGDVVTPFFDTQIAAMVCGYGDSVGYESLVRNITGKTLDKSVQFTDWSRRPLSERQINYALGDVLHLIDLYKHLRAELDKRGRTEWVFEEEQILAAPATYQNNPEDAWKRIKLRSPKPKTLAILREIAAWRETRAQERDIPRTWILRDETLADIAAQAPETPEQLAKIRGMNADQAKGHIGKAILELIEKAVNSDKKDWPKPRQKEAIPSAAAAAIDVLRMLLKVQATENGVAAKLIADAEDLEALALHDAPDIPAMRGWRYEIFGREAVALRNGEIAIGLKGSKIVKHKVT